MDKSISENFIFGEYVVAYKRRTDKKLSELPSITTSKQVKDFFDKVFNDDFYEQEKFYVLYMNNAGKVYGLKRIGEGSIRGVAVDISMIIRHALLFGATRLVLCHNHPSGNSKPSIQDVNITNQIKSACTYHELTLNDHVIYCGKKDDHYSFADEGLL